MGQNKIHPFLAHLYMHVHVQAMNENCGGEMSMEVVVDGNLWIGGQSWGFEYGRSCTTEWICPL